MKKLVYTTIAAAALSLGTSVAYAQFGGIGASGSIGAGSFDNSSGWVGGNINADYGGTTFSGQNGTTGVATNLEARLGTVSSQAFVAGGNLVGSSASADFSNFTQPFQNSESYQIGANFEQSSASVSTPSLGGNSATVDAMSFQNFDTNSYTRLDTGFDINGGFSADQGSWESFDLDFGGFVIFP